MQIQSFGVLAAAGATVGLIAGGLLTRYAGLAHRATGARRPAGRPLRGGWPLISSAAGHAAFRPIRCATVALAPSGVHAEHGYRAGSRSQAALLYAPLHDQL